jgi:hypothetical protein
MDRRCVSHRHLNGVTHGNIAEALREVAKVTDELGQGKTVSASDCEVQESGLVRARLGRHDDLMDEVVWSDAVELHVLDEFDAELKERQIGFH